MMHVVLYSSGIGSWAAAQRVAAGTDDEIILLFTDTKIEDEDNYRFLQESAATVPRSRLEIIADGRDVWELFFDDGYIGNTRNDNCSRVLKRQLGRDWIEANCDPDDSVIYLGIDWTEMHRYERAVPHWEPWTLKAPLCDSPYLTKPQMLKWAADLGLRPPRMYDMGFPHANCGGFCVKQGQSAFLNLLRTMPERYAYHEAKEQEFRDTFDKDVAILRDRRGGDTTPFTLRELRERAEEGGDQMALGDDWGGCGCMVDFG